MADSNSRKRKCESELKLNDSDSDEPFDEVKLWESGWKERYYRVKFQIDDNDVAFRHKIALAYVEGLCWVLQYYYQGCQSWNWYFPYHYAPFASDFLSISQFKPDFTAPTEPFKPLQQLMAVFPAASRMHLPEPWQELMISSESSIIDFYPDDFVVDLNGKKFAWQGVALLPFVDEKRLLEVLQPMEAKLDDFERERNSRGRDRVFVGQKHSFYKFVDEIYNNSDKMDENLITIDPQLINGMSGRVSVDEKAIRSGQKYASPLCNDELFNDIATNTALMAIYEDPQFEKGYTFPAIRLSGAIDVPPTLKDNVNWDYRAPHRPQIGFSRNVPRGGLSDAGRRMIDHSTRGGSQPIPLRSFSQSDIADRSQSGHWNRDRHMDSQPNFQQYQQHSNYGNGRSQNANYPSDNNYAPWHRRNATQPQQHQPSSYHTNRYNPYEHEQQNRGRGRGGGGRSRGRGYPAPW